MASVELATKQNYIMGILFELLCYLYKNNQLYFYLMNSVGKKSV